ncbi:MAG TPA: hypothetical protein VGU68_20240 [Ktedonobacteraceae bacterium]|nr:hypothetical protein [Ktedonobacteraceae bacterium]
MVILIALIFRLTRTPKLVKLARSHAEKGLLGRMEVYGEVVLVLAAWSVLFFADLIILPILDIYRKYYGWKVMCYILLTFYVTMAAAGYIVEFLFGALGIIPTDRNGVAISEGVTWNYTTILNIIFLVLAAILVIRFIHTGGLPMLRMMSKPALK